MFQSVNLEMSLKPFRKTDEDSVRKVCAAVYDQWQPLLRGRKKISILLWVGDGSEILDYAGDPGEAFEWAYFLGTANNPMRSEEDEEAVSLHRKKRLYTKEPPVMTYGILKRIVALLKEEGRKRFPDSAVRVGETFDIGPEFAVSDFKYKRHPEITSGTKLDRFGFIDATAKLKGDERAYAGWPEGIPDGTPFGTFFGRQADRFLRDMGFDYIWLSNGLGFSAEPWALTGKIYDGERFYPERLPRTRNAVFGFWKLFRGECAFPIETRGTNNTVGIDYATDGVPLSDIYGAGFDITPPPNSPWAALNDRVGLEMTGHMTRNAELPGESFKFRYYLHDPWWVNSPWYDRYDSSPYDIYLPMAVSRIDGEGKTGTANDFNILSIDNSFGDMPDSCAYEALPHILKAEKDLPDEPAPFVLVYPFREFTTAESEELLREMYFGDRFLCDALDRGFPLNCVISSGNFLKAPEALFRKSVIVTPFQPDGKVREKLIRMAGEGQEILTYASAGHLEALGPNGNIERADLAEDPGKMLERIRSFGYDIAIQNSAPEKRPNMTVARSDNAFLFSIYNRDTASDFLLRFPLGAPLLNSFDAELRDGKAGYRFPKCVHRECRFFVRQEKGRVTVREEPPCSGYYRRRIRISGLENATVCFFPEKYCETNCDFADARQCTIDSTPVFTDAWKPCFDERYGHYYLAENVTGSFFALMPFPEAK